MGLTHSTLPELPWQMCAWLRAMGETHCKLRCFTVQPTHTFNEIHWNFETSWQSDSGSWSTYLAIDFGFMPQIAYKTFSTFFVSMLAWGKSHARSCRIYTVKQSYINLCIRKYPCIGTQHCWACELAHRVVRVNVTRMESAVAVKLTSSQTFWKLCCYVSYTHVGLFVQASRSDVNIGHAWMFCINSSRIQCNNLYVWNVACQDLVRMHQLNLAYTKCWYGEAFVLAIPHFEMIRCMSGSVVSFDMWRLKLQM